MRALRRKELGRGAVSLGPNGKALLLASAVRKEAKRASLRARKEWVTTNLPCLPAQNCYHDPQAMAYLVTWVAVGSTVYGVFVDKENLQVFTICFPADIPPQREETFNRQFAQNW